MKRFTHVAPLLLASLWLAANTQAQTQSPMNITRTAPVETRDPTTSLEDIGWIDRSKMDKEISKINELAQSRLGASLRRDLSDLDTLQRIIDGNLVKREDYASQQAMGVVMAQVFLADFPQTLEWKIYRDSLGRSRALCAKGTMECLFPITMLSRRMEVGSQPNVRKIYQDAIDMLADYLPKIPYTEGEILYRLPR